jgi:hypothetical protein
MTSVPTQKSFIYYRKPKEMVYSKIDKYLLKRTLLLLFIFYSTPLARPRIDIEVPALKMVSYPPTRMAGNFKSRKGPAGGAAPVLNDGLL